MIKNLVTNADLKALKVKDQLSPFELELLQQAGFKEQQLQIACKKIFDSYCLQKQNCLGFFQQNDNGGYSNIATKKSKAAQGTIAGWPDVTLWQFKNSLEKNIFVEFKAIGINKISSSQQLLHSKLDAVNKKVYVCNNTVYFREVILNNFFKDE